MMLTRTVGRCRPIAIRSGYRHGTGGPTRLYQERFPMSFSSLAGRGMPYLRCSRAAGRNGASRTLLSRPLASPRNAPFAMGLVAALMCCVTSHLNAQEMQRVEPVLLTTSPEGCESPAAIASQRVALPRGASLGAPATRQTPVRRVTSCSSRQPLPADRTPRDYRSFAPAKVPTPETITVYRSNNAGTYVLRPNVLPPAAQAVPEGYVVGWGLIGQPKLYKPGQPIRNFLRFLTF